MNEPPFTILNKKWIYESDWFSVGLFRLRLPDGTEIDHHVVDHHRDAVAVVPVTDDGRILLVRTYRFIHEKFLWEVPSGSVDAGESPEEAGRREFSEETGYKADRFVNMFCGGVRSGVSSQVLHAFAAFGARRESETFDTNEIIEVKAFDPDGVLKMIADNDIYEFTTMIALLHYNQFHRGPQ